MTVGAVRRGPAIDTPVTNLGLGAPDKISVRATTALAGAAVVFGDKTYGGGAFTYTDLVTPRGITLDINNGRFTFARAGDYHIAATLVIYPPSANRLNNLTVTKNSSVEIWDTYRTPATQNDSVYLVNDYNLVTITFLHSFAADDYVRFHALRWMGDVVDLEILIGSTVSIWQVA